MMLRRILAGAVLAAGFPASGHAADLGVLTSLDVCDALGISGLTISSDTNCLSISGSVYYEFAWGEYNPERDIIGSKPVAYTGDYITIPEGTGTGRDWNTYYEAYLKLTGTSDSDFGPARAVVELYGYHDVGYVDGAADYDDKTIEFDYAYVEIGDKTVLSAGYKDSIANLDDDEPFGWLPTFIAEAVDLGVGYENAGGGYYVTGGHGISVVHDAGNGLTIGAALESLEDKGTAVGVITYASDTLTAHATVVAGDILDGAIEDYAVHAGITATLDILKLRAAIAANDTGWWNGLASAEVTFDMFSLAATVEGTAEDEFGAGVSASWVATDAVTLKAALRYVDTDTLVGDDEGIEARARIEYAVSESLTLAAEGGHVWVGPAAVNGEQSIFDGLIEATWSPGGGFSTTLSGAANTIGAYKVFFSADKSFD